MTNEYDWQAKIISSNRITIPDFIIRQWDLKEGDVVLVNVRKPVRNTRDVII
jgi:bifunctional DNA-binding transcriptional regulator/antitoxin component of YhaV-PrlF toxin-antitoxin module